MRPRDSKPNNSHRAEDKVIDEAAWFPKPGRIDEAIPQATRLS